ncbi:ExiS [Mycoplasma phage MAV1]|nr:ExiS [Mycoplasma phage MAV1]AAC33781.1 ExiS [Mycoplasma phage MAV1]
MKLPTWKELKLNIKAALVKLKPTTFQTWKEHCQTQFLKKLKVWMSKNEIDFKLIAKYYEILFYWSFINFRREEELIKTLTTNGYEVKRSNIKQDGIFKIDLIVFNNSNKYHVQIKNQISNLKTEEELKFKSFSNKINFIPLLAFKNKNQWKFISLISQGEIKLF